MKKTKLKKSDISIHLLELMPGAVVHVDGVNCGVEGTVSIRAVDGALEVIASKDAIVLFLRQQ